MSRIKVLVVLACVLLISSSLFAGQGQIRSPRASGSTPDGAIWGAKSGVSQPSHVRGVPVGVRPEGAIWGGAIWGGRSTVQPNQGGRPSFLTDLFRTILEGAIWGGGSPVR